MMYLRRTNYDFNKKLLLVLGLLPTPDKRFRIFRIFVYVVYLPYVLLQASWFYTDGCNLRCAINISSLFLINVICVLKYVFYHLRGDTVSGMYKEIEFDWKCLRNDKQSIEILRKYAGFVHVITIALMILLCVGTVTSILSCVLMPKSPDYMRFWHILRSSPFFMDDKPVCKSGFLILIMATVTGFLILVSTDTTYMVFSEHVCGLFKIVSYHLKYAAHRNTDFPACNKSNDIYERIVFAVRLHVRAIKLLQFSWDKFKAIFIVTLFIGTMIGIASLITFCQSVASKDDWRLTIMPFLCVLSVLIYASLVTHLGQQMTDHSLSVFHDAYNSNWYEIPLGAQKFYLIIMQRSINSCTLSIAGVFISSKEGFASFLQSTFSFFTVFYSMQV